MRCEIKNGPLIEYHNYQFDTDNLVKKYEWGDNEEGIAEITTYTYENKKMVKEHWVLYIDGEQDGYVDYKFENGNEVEVIEFDDEGNLVSKETCIYKFDAQGNWIKKTIKDGDDFYIVNRNIEYY